MLCFALLAHKDEYALLQQVRNIRKYNGQNVKIVLYNGSNNPNFGKMVCKNENIMYCPYSRPLEWGKTGRFFYDVMRWLEKKKVKYDYLVYTEYDVLFMNHGLEKLLEEELKGYDFIGRVLRKNISDPNKTIWKPGVTMWKEWGEWKPFFQSDRFYGTSNPMQVYRHSIIKRMLARIDKPKLERLLGSTKVFALGEMLYITLAVICGGRGKQYPDPAIAYMRTTPRLKLKEAKDAKRKPEVLFVHPVKDSRVRNWICKQFFWKG